MRPDTDASCPHSCAPTRTLRAPPPSRCRSRYCSARSAHACARAAAAAADPLGVLLCIDYLALRCRQCPPPPYCRPSRVPNRSPAWTVAVFRRVDVKRAGTLHRCFRARRFQFVLDFQAYFAGAPAAHAHAHLPALPNWAFSAALALWNVEKGSKGGAAAAREAEGPAALTADERLQLALLRCARTRRALRTNPPRARARARAAARCAPPKSLAALSPSARRALCAQIPGHAGADPRAGVHARPPSLPPPAPPPPHLLQRALCAQVHRARVGGVGRGPLRPALRFGRRPRWPPGLASEPLSRCAWSHSRTAATPLPCGSLGGSGA